MRALNGLVGPAGLSKDLAERLNHALVEVSADAEVRARFAELGLVADSSAAEAFAEHINA